LGWWEGSACGKKIVARYVLSSSPVDWQPRPAESNELIGTTVLACYCNFLETFLALVGQNTRVELTLDKRVKFRTGRRVFRGRFDAVGSPAESSTKTRFILSQLDALILSSFRAVKRVAMIWFSCVESFWCGKLVENAVQIFVFLVDPNDICFAFLFATTFVSSCELLLLELSSVSLR
jgi:hypothetical protein